MHLETIEKVKLLKKKIINKKETKNIHHHTQKKTYFMFKNKNLRNKKKKYLWDLSGSPEKSLKKITWILFLLAFNSNNFYFSFLYFTLCSKRRERKIHHSDIFILLKYLIFIYIKLKKINSPKIIKKKQVLTFYFMFMFKKKKKQKKIQIKLLIVPFIIKKKKDFLLEMNMKNIKKDVLSKLFFKKTKDFFLNI